MQLVVLKTIQRATLCGTRPGVNAALINNYHAMLVLIIGQKCTLAASHAAPW